MMTSQLQLMTVEDYEAALGRIAAGEHTMDDLNLVRAWEARMVQERQQTIDAIRQAVSAIDPAMKRCP